MEHFAAFSRTYSVIYTPRQRGAYVFVQGKRCAENVDKAIHNELQGLLTRRNKDGEAGDRNMDRSADSGADRPADRGAEYTADSTANCSADRKAGYNADIAEQVRTGEETSRSESSW